MVNTDWLVISHMHFRSAFGSVTMGDPAFREKLALANELLARASVNLDADTLDEIAANLADVQKELMADDIKHESADSSDPQPDPNAGPSSQPAALALPPTEPASAAAASGSPPALRRPTAAAPPPDAEVPKATSGAAARRRAKRTPQQRAVWKEKKKQRRRFNRDAREVLDDIVALLRQALPAPMPAD